MGSSHSCNENRNNCAYNLEHDGFVIGDNDLDLMRRLCAAGSDHRKFMRMIAVSCDIIAPLYWWKEFDTYKVGTVANSCSTMHKIHAKEFTIEDFSHEHMFAESLNMLKDTINTLEFCRYVYVNWDECKDTQLPAGIKTKKDLWWQMISAIGLKHFLIPILLPEKQMLQIFIEKLFVVALSQQTNRSLMQFLQANRCQKQR